MADSSQAPNSVDEYNDRFARSQRIEGFGLETTNVAPCPFCAAPDWAKWPVMSADEAMEKEVTCNECGRSAKAIVERSADRSVTRVEFVQTGGPDQPEWLNPKMRRVDRPEG